MTLGGKKTYYIIIAVLVIIGWAAALIAYVAFKRSEEVAAPVFEKVHFAGDPTTLVENIALKFVYVAPQAAPAEAAGVEEAARSVFKSINSFHELQFAARSHLAFSYYSGSVVFPLPAPDRDAQKALDENPGALSRARQALDDARKASPPLDRFLGENPSAFTVTVLISEGRGLAGEQGVVLVPRVLLTEPEYAVTRSSVFYYALARALGLEGGTKDGEVASDDIMGSGRYLPLGLNYISREHLVKMGLID